MAEIVVAARPKSFSFTKTGVGETAKTVTGLKSVTPVDENELLADIADADQLETYYAGKLVQGVEIETKNMAFYEHLAPGQGIATFTIEGEPARKGAGGALQFAGVVITRTCTNALVVSRTPISLTPGGQPSSYRVRILMVMLDGTAGTKTETIAVA